MTNLMSFRRVIEKVEKYPKNSAEMTASMMNDWQFLIWGVYDMYDAWTEAQPNAQMMDAEVYLPGVGMHVEVMANLAHGECIVFVQNQRCDVFGPLGQGWARRRTLMGTGPRVEIGVCHFAIITLYEECMLT